MSAITTTNPTITKDKEIKMSRNHTTQRSTARKSAPITIAPAHIVAGLATEGVTVRPQAIRRFLRTNADRFPKRDGGYRFTRTEAEAIIAELMA